MKSNHYYLAISACLALVIIVQWIIWPASHSHNTQSISPSVTIESQQRPDRPPDFQGIVESISAGAWHGEKDQGRTYVGICVRCPPRPPHPEWPPGSPLHEVRYIVGCPSGVFDAKSGPVTMGSLVGVWHTGAMGRSDPPSCEAVFVTTERWASIAENDPLQRIRPK
jgi:hypothetical protein